jgi:hypothetical protein
MKISDLLNFDFDYEFNLNCNTIVPYLKYLIIFIIFLFIFGIVLFIITSYLLFKLFKWGIDYNTLFYKYNRKCQKILDEYGKCKINNVYLIRQPFGKIVSILCNLVTCFQYNKYILESQENYPYHTGIILEVKNGKNTKFLLLEKNNCVNISETFLMHKSNEVKKIQLPPGKQLTLNKLLRNTKKRIGNNQFFNWNINKNNCQSFTNEILKTIYNCETNYNKNHSDFIFRDKMISFFHFSDFSLYMLNSFCIFYKFIETYILDNNIFY